MFKSKVCNRFSYSSVQNRKQRIQLDFKDIFQESTMGNEITKSSVSRLITPDRRVMKTIFKKSFLSVGISFSFKTTNPFSPFRKSVSALKRENGRLRVIVKRTRFRFNPHPLAVIQYYFRGSTHYQRGVINLFHQKLPDFSALPVVKQAHTHTCK